MSCFMSDRDGDSPLDALRNTDEEKKQSVTESEGSYFLLFSFSQK